MLASLTRCSQEGTHLPYITQRASLSVIPSSRATCPHVSLHRSIRLRTSAVSIITSFTSYLSPSACLGGPATSIYHTRCGEAIPKHGEFGCFHGDSSATFSAINDSCTPSMVFLLPYMAFLLYLLDFGGFFYSQKLIYSAIKDGCKLGKQLCAREALSRLPFCHCRSVYAYFLRYVILS